MRTIYSILTCLLFTVSFTFAQDDVVCDIPAFSKIDFEGNGELILIQGDEHCVEIDTREYHHIDRIVTEVRGNTLHIYYNEDYYDTWSMIFERFPKMYVTVTYQNLDEIEVEGKVKIIGNDPIRAEEIELDFTGFITGELELYAQHIELDTEGYTKMDLYGETKSQEICMEGMGRIDASELQAAISEVDLEGRVTLRINTTEELDADVSGLSNIYYKGKPQRRNIDRDGFVRVRPCRF